MTPDTTDVSLSSGGLEYPNPRCQSTFIDGVTTDFFIQGFPSILLCRTDTEDNFLLPTKEVRVVGLVTSNYN